MAHTISRDLAKLVKNVRLYIQPDQVAENVRGPVADAFVMACADEFPNLVSAKVVYKAGDNNRGFVELAGELENDRRPEEDLMTAALHFAFGLFMTAYVSAVRAAEKAR